MFIKKKPIASILLCGLTIGLCACSVEEVKEEPKISEQQSLCEHEWVEIECHLEPGNINYDIYCPKCQLETNVPYKEWNRIQADMEYKKGNIGNVKE